MNLVVVGLGYVGLPLAISAANCGFKVFGYDIHDNICTQIPYDFKLPGSYLFDFDFNGVEIEYPFTEQEELYDFEKIIQSIDKQ